MSVNYASEYKNFEKKQARQAMEYRNLGMSEEQISQMYEFDKKQFLSNLRHKYHNQPMPECDGCDEGSEGMSPLLKKHMDALSVTDDYEFSQGRYGWVDDIEDTVLTDKLKKMSADDLELITLIVIDGHSQTDVALLKGTSKQAISKKIYQRFPRGHSCPAR